MQASPARRMSRIGHSCPTHASGWTEQPSAVEQTPWQPWSGVGAVLRLGCSPRTRTPLYVLPSSGGSSYSRMSTASGSRRSQRARGRRTRQPNNRLGGLRSLATGGARLSEGPVAVWRAGHGLWAAWQRLVGAEGTACPRESYPRKYFRGSWEPPR